MSSVVQARYARVYLPHMERKKLIWIGILVGSFIGSYVPLLWGAGVFSFSSIILGGVGSVAGIYLGFRLGE